MKKNNVVQLEGRGSLSGALTDLLKTGAQQLLSQAIEAEVSSFLAQAIDAEVSSFLAQFETRRVDNGWAAALSSGHQPEREIQTGFGPVSVKVPKLRSRDGKPVTVHSAPALPFIRQTKTLEAALLWLYLKGISSGEIKNALEVLVGPEAKSLSAGIISRLKQSWGEEYNSWCDCSLDKDD